MKISILGAGAMGCLFGARLSGKNEIDYINGAVSALGKQYGVPTPTNDAIINLVHAKEYINRNA